ncbi:MAG: outer membrane beta-barrel protein [Chitinophagaceae bacterium]|nr:outer membrane beta-barrel protein [Chitinophagaceae bacterium]
MATSFSLSAQSSIRGTVTSKDNTPVAAANVLLLKSSDSTLVKGTITNTAGKFSLDVILTGDYTIQVSFAGMETILSPLVVNRSDVDAGNFQLKPGGLQLEKVTVSSRRPLFEQKIDRMVVNVRNSITAAGSTVLDVLERSPGIVVNRQNNSIAMNGKDGVSVMINGKLTRMPMSALVQMLSGMNASNIDKIELITTPPANFDAEGNAGFINIVMITNPNQGLNGSYTLSFGYGRGEIPGAGINFNYRKNRFNLYGDYSFSRLHTQQIFSNYRRVRYMGNVTENYVESDRNTFQRNHNLNLGADYELTKKTVVGVLVATYNNRWSMDAENLYSKRVNSMPDTSTTILNDEVNHWKHYMADVNLQHKFKDGENISFDVNYLWYNDNNPTDYTNHYYNGQGTFLSTDLTKSRKKTPIEIWVGTTDYNVRLSKKWNLQTGLKFTSSRFTNDVAVERYQQNVWMQDPELTSLSNLKENIAAVYSSFTGDITARTSVKLGLRYEYTTSNLGTPITPDIVDRKYGRLFPTIFIGHKLNDDNSFNLTFSRRINRPTFNDMAPFIIFMDPNTFFSGNAALQPSITNTMKGDYILKNYVFSLTYSIESNTIARFQTEVDVSTNKQTLRAQNLDETRLLTASLALPFNFNKWWTMQLNVIGSRQEVSAFYNKEPVKLSLANFNVSGAQTFKLPKDYTLELSGFYQSPSLFGISRFRGLGRIDVGAQKKLGKKGGTLRFAVNDIFQSMQLQIYSDMPAQDFYFDTRIRFAYRTFRLTWTCPFGNKDLRNKRSRNTGSEEERRRVTQ